MRKRLVAPVFPSKLSHVIKYHGGQSKGTVGRGVFFSANRHMSANTGRGGGLKSPASNRGHNNVVGHCYSSTSVTLTELSPH